MNPKQDNNVKPSHLRLIGGRPVPAIDIPPIFLTEDRCSRLAEVNAAVRTLREMGYRVSAMRLDAPTRPKVVIALGKDQSIVPLLNMTHRPGFVAEDGIQYGYVVFKEVGVLWRVQ